MQFTNIEKVRLLLSQTGTILNHHKDLERIKGESFNLFSILKMERLENRTHSAFIGELLNPQGSHMQGTQFLKLFIDVLKEKMTFEFDTNTAKCQLEFHIGARNDELKSGGRIDIYLFDVHGNTISIENKIDAIDQNTQVERYFNHNRKKNTVCYLTLEGDEPTSESKGSLIPDQDFVLLSYREDISKWLKSCQKEAVQIPILRESIRQYQILIQRITSTMNEQEEKQLINLILENYEEAQFVKENLDKAKDQICEEIRLSVMTSLSEKINKNLVVNKGASINSRWAQIWINFEGSKENSLCFGIESFSGRGHVKELFIGTFIGSDRDNEYIKKSNVNPHNSYWVDVQPISAFEGYEIQMENSGLLRKIHRDNEFKKQLIDHITQECLAYLSEKMPLVEKYI